jgi:hypothetical protein
MWSLQSALLHACWYFIADTSELLVCVLFEVGKEECGSTNNDLVIKFSLFLCKEAIVDIIVV